MCDYSLELQASRAAFAGDRLVTTAFPGSMTLGFAADETSRMVICLMPGTELAFDAPVSFTGLFRFLLQGRLQDAQTARFRHVNEDNPLLHHDALEFGNGQLVLLASLQPGQRARVVKLPAILQAVHAEAIPA